MFLPPRASNWPPKCLVRRRLLFSGISPNSPSLHAIATLLITIIITLLVPNAQSFLQQVVSQPIFIKNMNQHIIRENTPVGELVYTLEAILDPTDDQVRIEYDIEGTQLFRVDQWTGEVRVTRPIDREQTTGELHFRVSATPVYNSSTEGGKLMRGPSTKLAISVLIIDENDNPPRIERVKVGLDEYDWSMLQNGRNTISLHVSEATLPETTVVDLIEAFDLDTLSTRPLRATCLGCDEDFEVRLSPSSSGPLLDRLNASIVLTRPLVHVPRNNTRHLNVTIYDDKFGTTVAFEIIIDNVQNRPPLFLSSTTCTVQENSPIDFVLMIIQAVDGDAMGAEVDSLTPIPTNLTLVQGRQILYTLEGTQSSNKDFKLHPLKGLLQVANRLDREAYLSTNGVLSLRVRARELRASARLLNLDDLSYESMLERLTPFVASDGPTSNEVDISVILIDVNDNEPRWLNSSEIAQLNMNQLPDWYSSLPSDTDTGRSYDIQIKENSQAGSPITSKNEIFVYDLDYGENASFNISLEDPSKLFDVEPKQVSQFALISLKLASGARKGRLLDYENMNDRNFIIQLVATELTGGASSKAQVRIKILDVNDNAPEFTLAAYQASIKEDSPVGAKILSVQATDRDEISKNQLSYTLHGNSAHLFDINHQTGLITVARCESGRLKSHSQRERAQRGQSTGKGGQCLDFEWQRSHHLMVEVSDGELVSKVPLSIMVEDANDNAPVFTLDMVDAVIEEGAERIDPPIRIEAVDLDTTSVLSYSIVEGNEGQLFSINNGTGELQLTRPITIPNEDLTSLGAPDYYPHQMNKITLKVQASDGLHAVNGSIRIDVLDANDNAPQFAKTHYQVDVHESISPGHLVATVRAFDADRGNNARVSYRLQRGSFGQFDINESTGDITVSQQASEFDSSKRENYTLEVVAYDHGLVSKSSSVQVHVRVLDTIRRAPEFDPPVQRATVLESVKKNTKIHRMSVATKSFDPKGQLSFGVGPIEALDKNGQPVGEIERLESMFKVSQDLGEVTVDADLNHDFAAYINLTVYVSSSSSQPEDSLANPLEPNTREYSPRAVGFLIISVVDDNTNEPVFAAPWSPDQIKLSFEMLEELPVGSQLTQLVASDVDSKISHFKIEPPNDYFELASPQSGLIINKRLIDYDSLMKQTYLRPHRHNNSSSRANLMMMQETNEQNNIVQFNVYVYDSGVPQKWAQAIVSVEILPINDNDCKFERPVYEVSVRENTPADTLVVQVRATDADYGEEHSSLRYQLLGDYSDLFNMDARSGLVTVSPRGSSLLDRERLSQSNFALTVIGRDNLPPELPTYGQGGNSNNKKPLNTVNSRSCSATIKIQVLDVNDNPPLFSQRIYEITAYDTDAIDVPLIKLVTRDDDLLVQSSNSTSKQMTSNTFRIVSGNINDSFNITNNGLLFATRPLAELISNHQQAPIQLKVQVKQHQLSGELGAFTDDCLVRINLVKINRWGPEWRFDGLKSLTVYENSRPGTIIAQLRCIDPDFDDQRGIIARFKPETSDNDNQRNKPAGGPSPMRYWIKENGVNVLETNEFRLDPKSGNLSTRVELDREREELYQLVVACEDNGRPQSLESVTPLFIKVLDLDDNKPEFVVPSKLRNQQYDLNLQPKRFSLSVAKPKQSISFSVEEGQTKGLPVGELKAIDLDLDSSQPIQYCLVEGNEFREFTLDRLSGLLSTNQSLDREKQATYELLVKAINDGSSCEEHMTMANNPVLNSTLEVRSKRELRSQARSKDFDPSLLLVLVNVLDINDNAPVFRRPIHRAGAHHRSLLNTLITQVAAFDPDLGLNGTLSYKISDVSLYKTIPLQQTSSGRHNNNNPQEVSGGAQPSSKPIKPVQSPFRIDQQGNIYSQQLLTQYQLMSMFVLQVEASEQAEPWRTVKCKVEIYVYETSQQLKIRINLHPRLVDAYRVEIETLLSNATKYSAIINRARIYHGSTHDSGSSSRMTGNHQKANHGSPPQVTYSTDRNGAANSNNPDEPTLSNIHLIFVDNFRIVNPNVVMEKFDLTSAQLFMPQTLTQPSANTNNPPRQDTSASSTTAGELSSGQRQVQVNEVSSLIDKIALASVQSAELQASPSTFAGVDWLEGPAAIYVALTILLTIVGFLICLFGCCCTSRIKDHIIKVAMDKLVKQQQLQARINEQVLAATNQQNQQLNGRNGGQDFILQQGGFMSSFDATKGCVTNNNENMSILQRALDSGEYLDPNYTTINGHINMGAHYYDASEIEQQQQADDDHHHQNQIGSNGLVNHIECEVGTSKNQLGSNKSMSMTGEEIDVEKGDAGANSQLMRQSKQQQALGNQFLATSRQRQQIPNQ